MRISCLVVAVAVALVANCGTYTTYQTAEPLAPGRWQVSAAGAYGAFADLPSKVNTPAAMGELAIRRGIATDTDAGFKLFLVGAELSVRHRFFDGEYQWAVLGALAWARTKETAGFSDAWFGEARLALAVTRRISPRWAFTAGPLVTASAYDFAGGGTASGLLLGAFASLEWTFSDARRWHLLPEVSFHGSIAGDVPVTGFVLLAGAALARDL